MCIAIPRKVVRIKGEEIIVDDFGELKKVKSMIKLSEGDYVVINNGIIMDKINKKQAMNFLKTIK